MNSRNHPIILKINLSDEAVDEYRFLLAKPIDAKYWLNVMRGIPRSIKDNNTIGNVQIDAKATGFCWYQKQSQSTMRILQ